MIIPNRKILVVDDDPEVIDTFNTILVESNSDEMEDLLGLLTTDMHSSVEESKELLNSSSDSFNLHTAESAGQAIELFKKAMIEGEPFSTVFIDIRMPPGMDGLKCSIELGEIDPNINIVIVSAYSDYSISDMQNHLEHDFLYLSKPFIPDELIQIAQNLSYCWGRDHYYRETIATLKDRLAATVNS